MVEAAGNTSFYWMVTLSDNTATNVILDTLGLDAVNEYCAVNLGLIGVLMVEAAGNTSFSSRAWRGAGSLASATR